MYRPHTNHTERFTDQIINQHFTDHTTDHITNKYQPHTNHKHTTTYKPLLPTIPTTYQHIPTTFNTQISKIHQPHINHFYQSHTDHFYHANHTFTTNTNHISTHTDHFYHPNIKHTPIKYLYQPLLHVQISNIHQSHINHFYKLLLPTTY